MQKDQSPASTRLIFALLQTALICGCTPAAAGTRVTLAPAAARDVAEDPCLAVTLREVATASQFAGRPVSDAAAAVGAQARQLVREAVRQAGMSGAGTSDVAEAGISSAADDVHVAHASARGIAWIHLPGVRDTDALQRVIEQLQRDPRVRSVVAGRHRHAVWHPPVPTGLIAAR